MATSTVMKKLSMATAGAALIGLGIATIGIGQAKAGTITFNNKTTGCSSTTYAYSSCFVEDGLNVEAFWASGVGSGASVFGGHFHDRNGAENQHWNGGSDLQGFLVKKTDGSAFSLNSLDYFITGLTSINGYTSNDVKVLVSTAFNPLQSVASQFTEFSIGNTLSNSLTTLGITGFDNVTQVFISSSASVSFDNVKTGVAKSVPEPASITALLGFGVLGASSLLKRKQQQKATVKA